MLLYTFTVTDPGPNDTFSVVSESATGGTVSNLQIGSTAGSTTGSFDVTCDQGVFTTSAPIVSTVSVTVQDNAAANGLTGTVSQSVAISPVAPTVTLSGETAAFEGDTKQYTFTVSDPDTLDAYNITAPRPAAER